MNRKVFLAEQLGRKKRKAGHHCLSQYVPIKATVVEPPSREDSRSKSPWRGSALLHVRVGAVDGSAPPPTASPKSSAIDRQWLVGLVFAAGVVYTLAFVAVVRDEVFYSGDAGIKALLVKQFAHGLFGTGLKLRAPGPIRELWERGLYPFIPPFVYHTNSDYLVSFPVFFEATSAPFYRWLGFRGLYVIPILSLWALWLFFWRTLRRLELPMWAIALGLGSLIFASHLTVYAGTFWEHTFGALLAYAGIDYFAGSDTGRSCPKAALLGFICACSFLLRPEGLLLILVLCAFGCVRAVRGRGGTTWSFVGGMIVGLALILGANVAVYDEPLGLHGRQVVHDVTLSQHAGGAFSYGVHIIARLCLHVPVIAFVLVSWVLISKKERRFEFGTPWGVLVPCLLFLVGLPFIVPNDGGRELGPRYTLLVVPAFLLVAAVAAADLVRRGKLRFTLLALLAGGVALGAVMNLRDGWHLIADYRTRVNPGLAFLRSSPANVVIVDQSFVAQELEASMPEKSFLLIASLRDFELALGAARDIGPAHALFASFVGAAPPVFPADVAVMGHDHVGTFDFYDLDLSHR